jgi:hypothetical protein
VPYPLSPYLSRTPFHRQNPSNLWSSVNQLNRSVSLDICRFSICFHQLTVWSTGFSEICYIYLCIPVHRWWFFIKVYCSKDSSWLVMVCALFESNPCQEALLLFLCHISCNWNYANFGYGYLVVFVLQKKFSLQCINLICLV